MSNPFGVPPTPWRRRVWNRDRSKGAPKRYTVPAAGLGALLGLVVAHAHGIDHIAKGIVVVLAPVLPHMLMETWWKRRCRWRAEQLFVLPSEGIGT
jgi:Flp pilus assembly protein TadB